MSRDAAKARDATPAQICTVLERAADLVYPDQYLFFAVVVQAVRDAALKPKGDIETEAVNNRMLIREDARKFFFLGGYRRYAELCGLSAVYVRDLLIEHTTWARRECFV